MKPAKASVPDVSVVVVVRNAEDVIGSAIGRVVAHLRELNRSFEVIAVNAGSWDTSFAVLGLMTSEVPELRLLPKDVGVRALVRGATEARGDTLLLLDATRMPRSFSALGWTLGRIAGGVEAVVLRGRWIAARRLLALPAIARGRGLGEAFERSFEREARGLALETIGSPRRSSGGFLGPVFRLLSA